MIRKTNPTLVANRLKSSCVGAFPRTLVGTFLRASIATFFVANVFLGSSLGQSNEPRLEEGFTEPFKTVFIASVDSGVLHSVSVREGDYVSAGDVICTLDSHVLTASVNAAQEKLKAQGRINAAKASLDNKAQTLEQMKELLAQEHASDKEVNQAQLDFDLAAANLETARDDIRSQEMELKRIQAQLERRIIRAPANGFILELPRQVGEAITATESQVATLVALDFLRARYFLSTEQSESLTRGQRLTVSFPDTQQQAEAIVDFVSPITDSKSGTVRVELLIKNDKQQFRSGLRCLMSGLQAAQIKSTTNR